MEPTFSKSLMEQMFHLDFKHHIKALDTLTKVCQLEYTAECHCVLHNKKNNTSCFICSNRSNGRTSLVVFLLQIVRLVSYYRKKLYLCFV